MVQIFVDISTPSTAREAMIYHILGAILLAIAGICGSIGLDSLMYYALGAMVFVMLVPITGKASKDP